MPLNYDLSKEVARRLHSQVNRCWKNAFRAHLELPGLLLTGCYIEGWTVIPKADEVQIFEHGWCELGSGDIVDPSLVLTEPPTQPIFYYAGLRLSWFELQALPQVVTLPLACTTHYGPDGMEHPGYHAAYQAAQDMAEELARQLTTTVQVYHRAPPQPDFFEIMTSSGKTIGFLLLVQQEGDAEMQE